MNLDQVLGIVRALMTALGGAAIAHGYVTADVWTLASGAALSIITAGWSWKTHTLVLDQVLGVVRALSGAAGGYLIQRGWVTVDQVAQWSGVAVAIGTAVWSMTTHADPSKPPVVPPQLVAALALLPMFGLGGCVSLLNLTPDQRANLQSWNDAGKQVVKVSATLYCVIEPTTTQVIRIFDTSKGTATGTTKVDQATTIACQAAAKAGLISVGG